MYIYLHVNLTLSHSNIYPHRKTRKQLPCNRTGFRPPRFITCTNKANRSNSMSFALFCVWTHRGPTFWGKHPSTLTPFCHAWHMQLHIIYQTCTNIPTWWFQPLWKICSSKWVHLHQIGMKIKNIWSFTTQIQTIYIWRVQIKPWSLGCC